MSTKDGRPTKYRKEYCQMLIDHMGKQGLSYKSFAGLIGVNFDTLYAWEKKYKDFSESKAIGEAQNLVFWEKLGTAGAAGKLPGFNAACWNINMKNRHDWREKKDIDLSGTVSVNLNGQIVSLIEQLEREGSEDPEDC